MEKNIRWEQLLGKVKKVLVSTKIEPIEANYVGIELCETVHLHMPGFRWELTLSQLEAITKIFVRATETWKTMGEPEVDGNDFKLLADGYLPDEPVYNTRFEIEEQVIPSVHLHIRGLSIRLPTPNFIEFAKLIYDASQNLSE